MKPRLVDRLHGGLTVIKMSLDAAMVALAAGNVTLARVYMESAARLAAEGMEDHAA